MGVFITTAIFSIFAYVWMFIVLKIWTPNVVKIEEAILTLIFFILLVVLAFAADRYNSIKKKKLAKENNESPEKDGITRDEFYRIVGVKNSKNKDNKNKQKEIKNEKEILEESQITTSQKDVEGERLKNPRDTLLEGETKRVKKKIFKINLRKKVHV